jgi:hypothetical protein
LSKRALDLARSLSDWWYCIVGRYVYTQILMDVSHPIWFAA